MAYQPSAEAARVTELRKSGKLKEAYGYAKAEFMAGNCEETFMSAYTWVLHDCLKRYFDNSSRFNRDLQAFTSTLSQIRSFPINDERDGLFIENLVNKTRTVCWEVIKERNPEKMRLLASEITKWGKNRELYSADIARPLLVGLKGDQQGCAMMLHWLELPATTWDSFIKMSPEVIASQSSKNEVANVAVLWALYDDLKRCSSDEQGRGLSLEKFVQSLSLFRFFNLGSHEAREVLEYAVGKLVHIGWDCRKAKNLRGARFLLEEATRWTQDSMMHSSDVLLMFSKSLEDDSAGVIKLVEWFGLNRFSAQDFQEKKDGEKTYSSLAQSLTSQYLEALMACDRDSQPIASVEQKQLAVDAVAELLDSDRCKTWKWESYKFGLLLVETGHYEAARTRLANIVSSEVRQAWAWAAYGRAWRADSEEMYEQCLFKGLAVSNDIQTSLSVHEEALQAFARKGLYDYAKAEANLIESFRAEKEWKPSKVVEDAKSQDWFSSAEPRSDCDEIYERLSRNAEDILAEGLPWTEFYVEWEDREKGIVGIVIPKDYSKPGSLSINREVARGNLAEQLEVGKCYRGHCGSEKKSILGKVEECPNAEINSYFVSNYSGLIDLVKDFGFVRGKPSNVWVSPTLLADLGAKQYQEVTGECRSVYRKDKGWVWEAHTINLGSESEPSSFEREFEGYLEETNRGFGFVDNCFVPASLVTKAGGCGDVRVKARKSWDGKKNRWSWSAFELLDSPPDYDDYY